MSKRLAKSWRTPNARRRWVYWMALQTWLRQARIGYDSFARRRAARNVEACANLLGLTGISVGPRGGVTARALYKTRSPGARGNVNRKWMLRGAKVF